MNMYAGVMKSIAEWQLTARQPTAWQQHFYSLKKYCICLVDSWYIRPIEGGELKTVCSNTVCWSSLTFYVAYSWILLLVYKLETDSVHILFNYHLSVRVEFYAGRVLPGKRLFVHPCSYASTMEMPLHHLEGCVCWHSIKNSLASPSDKARFTTF